MSLCINPSCPKPADPVNAENTICRHCGSQVLLQKRYRVKRLLSDAGGFSTVYEADERGEPKILKVLKGDIDSQSKALELFQKEAEVLSKLRHPGIPKVETDGYFTFLPRDQQQQLHCLVMEKIEGLNLEEWMSDRQYQPITQNIALDWLKQITQILDQVHQQDYFHRDIKPPNIMLRPSGQLVLIDFGAAREVTKTYLAKVSGLGRVTKISSAGYTPPEQEKGYAIPQSDFYALGRTFVYLLTGKEPTDLDIYDPYNDELRWHQYAPQISSPMADFIDYLMAPKAGNRPHNTQVILQQLVIVERTLYSQSSQKPFHQPKSTPPTPKSRQLAIDAVLMVGLAVIAIGGGLQASRKPAFPEPAGANAFPSSEEPLSPSVHTNAFPSSQSPRLENKKFRQFDQHFPFKSQDQGVTLVVNSASQLGDSLLLNVTLKNEGTQAVQFLYGFLNVTDEQGHTLAAHTKGLPNELPANGEEFLGTVSIPMTLLGNDKKLSVILPDYPEQKLHLQISGIPVVK